MNSSEQDDLRSRLRLALRDIASHPHGDLVRNMAEEVASGDLQDLLASQGLESLQRLEGDLDPACRRALCRLALSLIANKSPRRGAAAEPMMVTGVTVTNTGKVSVAIDRDHWDEFGVTLQRCIEQEIDSDLAQVELEWCAAPVERCKLSTASGAIEAADDLRKNPPAPPAVLRPGKTRVLFGARLKAQRRTGILYLRPRTADVENLAEEWDRKVPRIHQCLRPALLGPIERVEELSERLSVRTTQLVALKNITTAFVHQDARDLASTGSGVWTLTGEALEFSGQTIPLTDSSIDLEQVKTLVARLNNRAMDLEQVETLVAGLNKRA